MQLAARTGSLPSNGPGRGENPALGRVEAKDQAVADVAAALAEGALSVGEEAGLPLHRFPLERTADAHAAVEGGAVGKVLIDIG